MEPFTHRSLLDIEGLMKVDVERILDTAEAFLQVSRRPVRKVPTLRGKTVINLFTKPPREHGHRSSSPASA